jgi:hypothetical protein
MHRDRNNGTWPELKAKRHDKFDNPKFNDVPLESLGMTHNHLQIKKTKVSKKGNEKLSEES